jgi:hypothetical protein
MSILTRTVLAWLLMLAIPVQGFAATAMLFCSPSHHGVITTVKTEQVVLDHHAANTSRAEHPQETMQHASHHGTATKQPIANANSQLDDSALTHGTTVKLGKLADGKCSACATCCTGSMLVGKPSLNTVATTGSDSIPFTLEYFVSYVPEGLDPPPRSLLA